MRSGTRGAASSVSRAGRQAEPLKAETPDVLFVPGKTRYRKIFKRAPDGHVTGSPSQGGLGHRLETAALRDWAYN